MTGVEKLLSVLCVDDNPQVADALKLQLARAGGFAWQGWLPAADDLVATALQDCPDIVLIDLDMPGRDPFQAIAELVAVCPASHVIVFSGHVRGELIDKALEAGAWGFVSKNDGEQELLKAIAKVSNKEVALSPQARATYDRL